MTILAEPPRETAPPTYEPRSNRKLGRLIVSWITSTDHKTIGYMYLIQSFVYFLIAGVDGDRHPRRADFTGTAVRRPGAVQPAVHDARHDHAVPVRDATCSSRSATSSCRCRSALRTSRSRG